MSARQRADFDVDGANRGRITTIDTRFTRQNALAHDLALARSVLPERDEEQSEAEDLDAELLRRLMVRLGVEEKKSKTILTSNTSPLRAYINKENDGSVNLSINDDFDRAWRRR